MMMEINFSKTRHNTGHITHICLQSPSKLYAFKFKAKVVNSFNVFNTSVCFRYADRVGHSYRPIEPDVKHELYGPLYETGCPLAEARQPEGKVTNNLLLFLNACTPFELPLITFTSLQCV